MCGIFGLFQVDIDKQRTRDAFEKTSRRGPDAQSIKCISDDIVFGFHRLAIVNLDEMGVQPFNYMNTTMVCNGEIYNCMDLQKYTPNIENWYAKSDCAVIQVLYDNLSMSQVCSSLDGVFAFLLLDKSESQPTMYAARDPFGVRPLYWTRDGRFFASEVKSLISLVDDASHIAQFPPGCWWSSKHGLQRYYEYIYPYIEYNTPVNAIRIALTSAVRKRMMSDRKIGCLLSGGLDSSLIAALVQKSSSHQIETFAIGMENSTDLVAAQKVADFINSKHHSVVVSEDDYFNAIPEVIRAIESYDITTVRASVGNYLVGKYIKENSTCTVIFNGDGSDEQSGYLYLGGAPNNDEFKKECIRLLEEIHMFDVLRSDRSISSDHSLEARTPFLDKDFVQTYMGVDTELKNYNNKIEKHLLRSAFANENLIPDEILWRRKEAFSDGCSGVERSWHSIIKERVDALISDKEFESMGEYAYNPPTSKEALYYRKIFDEVYPNCGSLLPHFWLPKYTDETDPSARELLNYMK
uniref:asparagine synthase (glutamine-hydrolyzing) n=1 Tax=Megaviridae environmental sample TaxID=1737588 RepID=A0A5J6VJZ1_9VIRU|nr:MAG: asparagine synthase [Megaviridae environmental sample]